MNNRLPLDTFDARLNAAGEFPAEAFDYNDDVTAEAVAMVREKAAAKIGDRSRWKQIDGFGQVIPA